MPTVDAIIALTWASRLAQAFVMNLRSLSISSRISLKHTVSGLLKLLCPNEQYDKEAVRRCPSVNLRTLQRSATLRERLAIRKVPCKANAL